MRKISAIIVLVLALCHVAAPNALPQERWTADIPLSRIHAKKHREHAPNVYALFVWGTLDENIAWATKVTQRKVLTNFYEAVRPSHCNFFCKSLEGQDAHPKNILAACDEFSRKAGKNDVVFVYVLCHGGQTDDSWANQHSDIKKRVHFLSPIAGKADDLKANEIGIRRASIMLKLKENPHRLDILITDSCTGKIPTASPKPLVRHVFLRPETTKLAKILDEGKGTINVNSTDPDYDRGEGQLALGWLPFIDDVNGKRLTGEAYFEAASIRPNAGTVFGNAFSKIITEKSDEKYTLDDFCDELKKRLDDKFQETIEYLDSQGDKSVQVFIRQGTQTLCKFNRFGQPVHWNFDVNTEW